MHRIKFPAAKVQLFFHICKRARTFFYFYLHISKNFRTFAANWCRIEKQHIMTPIQQQKTARAFAELFKMYQEMAK